MFTIHRNDTTPRARGAWARSIDELLAASERRPPLLRGMRSIYRRDVVAVCAPSLVQVRGVLADPSAAVRPEAMRRLRDFMSDGTRSPLVRGEREPARRIAHELALTFAINAGSGATAPVASVTLEEQMTVAA